MKIILLGAPGCGKGTQAKYLSTEFKIPHISTGDILRKNILDGTEVGKIAKKLIDNGQLVPDDLIIKIVENRLKEDDAKNGFILDGFPRTIIQAEKLENLTKIDKVFLLEVDERVIVDRICSRRVCPVCNSVYNLNIEMIDECKDCGATLIQRADDNEHTVVKRIEEYKKQTAPLIGFYESRNLLSRIDSTCREIAFEAIKKEIYLEA